MDWRKPPDRGAKRRGRDNGQWFEALHRARAVPRTHPPNSRVGRDPDPAPSFAIQDIGYSIQRIGSPRIHLVARVSAGATISALGKVAAWPPAASSSLTFPREVAGVPPEFYRDCPLVEAGYPTLLRVPRARFVTAGVRMVFARDARPPPKGWKPRPRRRLDPPQPPLSRVPRPCPRSAASPARSSAASLSPPAARRSGTRARSCWSSASCPCSSTVSSSPRRGRGPGGD